MAGTKEITELAITYRCPVTNVRYESAPWENVRLYSNYSGCDLCGQHGETTMYIECICGKTHELVVESQ